MNGGPLDRHRADATEVLAGGEAAEIKRLYVDLGDDLWEAHAGDPEAVPLFSLAGTHPVVADALSHVHGVVLDAGCGPNPALSIALASGPRRAVSLDIGLGTVRSALAVARARGVELLGVVGDVEALPFRSGAFAAVACDDTIEHLPDDRAGVAELARVVSPGSPVVIATPNRRSLGILRLKAMDRLRGRRKPAAAYFVSNSHLREYTWHELGDLVAPVLKVEERRGVTFDGRRAPALLVRIANPLVVRWPFRGLSPMLVLLTTSRR
jgi:SAM-dependent methyltransferase